MIVLEDEKKLVAISQAISCSTNSLIPCQSHHFAFWYVQVSSTKIIATAFIDSDHGVAATNENVVSILLGETKRSDFRVSCQCVQAL